MLHSPHHPAATRCCTARVSLPVLHSLVHQLSDSAPPTVLPVLHSLAPQLHLRLLRHHLLCAVLHSLRIACV